MAYVNKTFVVPEFAQQTPVQNQTPVDPQTGMAQGFGASIYPFLMGTGSKPVKNKQIQITTPYARENMLANREKIGEATRNLDEALKARETLGYTLANALANVPQQEGYGSWLSDFARGLGAGATGLTNAKTSRAKEKYENEMKDLAQMLAYDKAMGGTVETDLGYFYPESSNNDILTLALLLGNK